MTLRLKLKKRKGRFPPDPGRPDTLNYNEATNNPAWANEKKWADTIMDSVIIEKPIRSTDDILSFDLINIFI